MGLTLAVGWLALQKAELEPDEFLDFKAPYEALNEVLRQSGRPPHVEPEELPSSALFEAQMLGYSGLHSVRRLAAHWSINGALPEPDSADAGAPQDPVVQRLYDRLERAAYRSRPRGLLTIFSTRRTMFPHLMLHSDAEGFYVPRDFEDVIFEPAANAQSGLGGMVGSSVRLLEECELLAGLIGLPMDIDPEDDRLWDAAEDPAADGPLWARYGREAFGLARLIKACRLSTDHQSCVLFC